MIIYDKSKWWVLGIAFKGTVIRKMVVRLVFICALTVLLAILKDYGYKIPGVNSTLHTLLGTSLSLLLVFRTNASYDRYWEGRRLLGQISTQCRNVARAAACYTTPGASEAPSVLVQYINGFFIGLKLSLRSQQHKNELEEVIKDPSVVSKITKFPNLGFACLHMVSEWVDARVKEGHLERWHARSIEGYIANIADYQGGLERISSTPIPFAYAVHTHQFLMLYLLTLPFTMVTTYGYYGLVAVFTIGFGLIGIDEAGVEIEDPFGLDANDLPLELLFEKTVRLMDAIVMSKDPNHTTESKLSAASVRIQMSAGEDSGDAE